MSNDGRAVANFILDLCDSRGLEVTNLSLQKIAYFCHVWCLIRLGRPLIKQSFEAWQYGPVLQYLYREFKDYDSNPIRTRALKLDPVTGIKVTVNYRFEPEVSALLDEVVDFYARMRPSDLVQLSHQKDGPWDVAWNHPYAANPGMKISDDSIIDFYSKLPTPHRLQ